MADAADDLLTGVGELLFSLLIGYLGALEFAFVARHLYHWTCRHPGGGESLSPADAAADAEELPRLRERLDRELAEATEREAAAGTKAMQDGVLYSNGFRVESPEEKHKQLEQELERQRRIEQETRKQLEQAELRLQEERRRAQEEEEQQQQAAERRKAQEKEEEEQRQQAELRLAEERRQAQQQEEERLQQQRAEQESAESARKLIEAEREREAQQRAIEREQEEQREREENERKLLAAEKQREENERLQAEAERQAEEERKEREREQNERQQRAREEEAEAEAAAAAAAEAEQREWQENERKLRELERQRELAEAEAERKLLQQQEEQEEDQEQAKRDAEIVERLLAAEREHNFSATESELEEEALEEEQTRRMAASKLDLERKQRSIEENARIFMEAEEEMVALHQRMLQAAQEEEQSLYAGCVPVVEEPCIKKIAPPRFEEPQLDMEVVEEPLVVQRVKTQFGQGSEAKSKTLMFPGVSDEGSSVEPISSQQSSFSTQPSEERSILPTEEERQEPEGEDNVPDVQYTEDYLRSLDGIKSRPLVREDGSGRRRAFKKRRSSGSSNSSRDSRASRDEELKMFTSLEEEELRHGEKADYNPIKYSTEPALRVKSHHRRHKRSPAKDVKPTDSSGSLEMLGEESTNPWGEVVPEHYKDTEFWKREKALSIDEEVLLPEKSSAGEELTPELAKNKPKASSFEEATEAQNAHAVSTLLQQRSKEQLVSLLQASHATEEQPRRGSPGLRRSPRIDEMDHYEERWRESEAASQAASQQSPSISISQPDTAPWRDQYGLLMEGLSDFYDFTASTNPSRSRPSSRNASPHPKQVANRMDVDEEHTLEVYDDTLAGPVAGELSCEHVLQLLEVTMNGNEHQIEQLPLQNVADDVKMSNGGNQTHAMVYETVEDRRPSRSRSRSRSLSRSQLPHTLNELEQIIQQKDQSMERDHSSPMELEPSVDQTQDLQRDLSEQDSSLPRPVIEINEMVDEQMESPEPVPTREEMRLFVETLRAERNSRSQSRSRSRSPLPTSDNIARSLETRRLKRIKQNDKLIEKLHEDELQQQQRASQSPVSSPEAVAPAILPTICIEISEEPTPAAVQQEEQPEDTPESMARLFEQLRLNRCRSHSRSRSRSPLPTAANLEQGLQHRREKLIAQNDAFFQALEARARTPEPEVRVVVEHVYEFVESEEVHLESSRDARSLSPSRSRSRSRSKSLEATDEFHLMLNLEGSEQRILRQSSEQRERLLADNAKQRELDLEALHKLTHASEETELRVMSPPKSHEHPVDYERTISEAARDLKDEILVSGFKRSTYVGESLDLGQEFEQLRRECADFRRSRSPSPSLNLDVAREQAAAQRELQAAILNSLVSENESRLGARPKTSEYETERESHELEQGIVPQLDDLRHRTAEFQRSRSQSRSPVRDVDGGSPALKNIEAEANRRELQDQLLDQLAASSVNFQDFSRYLNADFLDSERRASDSALMQLDQFAELEPDEYHHFRRYSLAQEQPVEEYPSDECVYISQIEVRSLTGKRTWLKEDFYTRDLASLELELQEESEQRLDSLESVDESLITEGSWARAVLAAEAEAAEFDATNAIYNFDIVKESRSPDVNDDASSNDSDDERQTVVEMDDDDEYEFELDEGISDNNERTQPTDESHHDTSECEEAERNADRYANRGAKDWEEVDNVDDFADYGLDDGAVGGAYSDPDSFIEQIYNDAVKNRKQSGILREYETMIQEQLSVENADQSESEKEKSSSDSERYALWAKTRELDRSEESSSRHRDIDVSLGLLESERRDTEMRYLGDAQVAARQSTRLRTRYGYSPKLQVDVTEDDIDVDLNYKPKREYNWRKNFKLDDNEQQDEVAVREVISPAEEGQDREQDQEHDRETDREQNLEREQEAERVFDREQERNGEQDPILDEPLGEPIDSRRLSFGGESITLFSRSPLREVLSDVPEEMQPEQENGKVADQVAQVEVEPNNKKKKSKKKLRKGSKTTEELLDDNDSDGQPYTRRSSMGREDGEGSGEAPKRKMRSRRSSKSSSTNEEVNGGLFSPRNSVGFAADALEGIAEQEPTEETTLKKKTKKRKKLSKESREQSLVEPAEEQLLDEALVAALSEIAPISVSASANLTPGSTQQNLLSSISVGQSVCLTPASSFEEPASSALPSDPVMAANSTPAPATAPARSVVDTFDILKDANFYPLF
ncbi:hypothetical protein KR222_009740 [Zaprionus bogoriensis]|nr:hypothetical protein KR222_009740 [Zaprionus bogoriensis]